MPLRLGWNISRGEDLIQTTESTRERRLEVQRLNNLPPMSLVAQKLLSVLADDEMDIPGIAAIIEQDPALMARIIGVANSAYFGMREPVTTIKDAILKVLGLETTRNLALGLLLSGPLDPSRCPSYQGDRYWFAAISAAKLSQQLAKVSSQMPGARVKDAYLCGLLHNLGLQAMVNIEPELMSTVLAANDSSVQHRLYEIEQEYLGATHPVVGGWLVRKWHLPPHIVAVIEHHHETDYQGSEQDMVRLVGSAVRWLGAIKYSRDETPELAQLNALGIDTEQAQMIMDDLEEKRDGLLALAQLMTRS